VSSILRLALPRLSDWCAVFLAESDGQLPLKEIAHVDPTLTSRVRAAFERLPAVDERARALRYEVFRSRKPAVYPVVTDKLLSQWAVDDAHLAMLRQLRVSSLMEVPLMARGRALGVVLLGASESRRVFSPEDLTLAEELARRSAVSIDNQRVYADAREGITRRENLMAMISHDLGTPLTAVQMSAKLLSKHPHEQISVDRHVQTVLRASQRMGRLVRDLLDFTALGAGQLSIDKNPANLADIVTEAVESFRSPLQSVGITLALDVDQDLPRLICDRGRIVEVVENLLSNALKATATGGTITVRAKRRDQAVDIVVADSGSGIPAEDLPHIFERYYRGHEARGTGFGLGLAIACSIVESHGGRIRVESMVGKGSTFTVTLPLENGATGPGGG
jgi:signal transduction histidine kinase